MKLPLLPFHIVSERDMRTLRLSKKRICGELTSALATGVGFIQQLPPSIRRLLFKDDAQDVLNNYRPDRSGIKVS